MKILHTCLNVLDLDRSIDFYTNHLGLKLASRREVKQNNAEIAFMKDESGNAIELTYWKDKVIKEGDNFDHIAFGVSNVQSVIEDAEKEWSDDSHGTILPSRIIIKDRIHQGS